MIPVRAVASQTRSIVSDDDPDFPQSDPCDKLLEPDASFGGGGGVAEIHVDYQYVFLMPPELLGSLAQGVLQSPAFLVVEHLVGTRLSDVDYGKASQVPVLN